MFVGLISLSFAGAFTGASLYENLVEHPARLMLDDKALLREWAPSDHRAIALQGGLSLCSALTGLTEFHSTNDIRWLAGALVILASWLYTYFLVVPLNNRLLAIDKADVTPDVQGLMRDWGLLEWGQTFLGACAVAVFIWALV